MVNLLFNSMPAKLLLLLVFASPLAAQQTITLRFVDYQTGKPLTKVRVTAAFWNGTVPWTGVVTRDIQKVVAKLSAKTGSDGTISLPLPTPIPEHLEIISSFDTIDSLDTNLNVKQVLEEGTMTVVNADHFLGDTMLPKGGPGEVLVVTRKLTARDRVPGS